MINLLIRLFSRISHFFHLDLLWRISRSLSLSDRSYLALRILRKDNVEQITFRRDNTLWTTYGWDTNVTWFLLAHGHYHGEQIRSVLSWMRNHDRFTAGRNIIVDTGANIGTTCIPFAQQTDCHILAIEPFPESFSLLHKNVIQNGLVDRITCVKKAVYRGTETVCMVLPDGNCGGASVRHSDLTMDAIPDSDVKSVVDVPADGLINILTDAHLSPEQIAFVWSDTEGSEVEVIKTGTPIWSAGVPLYLELHPEALKRQGCIDEFKNLLTEYFNRFIKSVDLMAHDTEAPEYPITEIPSLIDHLDKKKDLTDVLVLPGNSV